MNNLMIEFKERNAVQIGNSYYINLPSIWVRQNNIFRGEKISISWNEKQGELIISKKEVSEDD